MSLLGLSLRHKAGMARRERQSLANPVLAKQGRLGADGMEGLVYAWLDNTRQALRSGVGLVERDIPW